MNDIPEIAALDARRHLLRIPPELDVPITDRVRRIIDSFPFQRLTDVLQLGFVPLVYPGARHTRFEHSLGVYRLALLFLKRLTHDTKFCEMVHKDEAELLIVAALLHDIGHWPYCHIIEDLSIPGIPNHESLARQFITTGEIAQLLEKDWQIHPADILALLESGPISPRPEEGNMEYQRRCRVFQILRSIVSGPIDIDKMDYLMRDSCYAGVPYGRNFDQQRLIGSLCINTAGNGLAITEKGKTAAELMVFARYVMFSEVYWHHTVRAATVMFQRAFELAYSPTETPSLVDLALQKTTTEWLSLLQQRLLEKINTKPEARGGEKLLDGLFGKHRSIYKRVWEFGILDHPTLYRRIAGQRREDLALLTARLIKVCNKQQYLIKQIGHPLGPNDLLLDAPPIHKEIEFAIEVLSPDSLEGSPLETLSPVVRALAHEQFDDCVKRVRFFAPAEVAFHLRTLPFPQMIKDEL